MAKPGAGPWDWTLAWPACNVAAMLVLAVTELALDHRREEAAAHAVNDVLKASQTRGAVRAPIEVSVTYRSRLESIQGITQEDVARIEAAIRPIIGKG